MQTFANLEADCYQCTGRGPSLHVHHFRDFYITQLPKDFQPLITKKILEIGEVFFIKSQDSLKEGEQGIGAPGCQATYSDLSVRCQPVVAHGTATKVAST